MSFPLATGQVDALKGVGLRVLPGKITALVGESGSGKSVLGQTIMGLAARPCADQRSGAVDRSRRPAARWSC